MTITIEEYAAYNPLDALLEGKPAAHQEAILGMFVRQDDARKEVMSGTGVPERIAALIAGGTLPASHGKAVAKLIGLMMQGEVTPDQVRPLLTKLDLDAARADAVAAAVMELVAPALEAPEEAPAMPEVPPLTTTTPPRTILDTRKPGTS